MSTTGASGTSGKSLVSSAERTGFVEAVLAGGLEPDFSAVAYHFEGWLDQDVVDAVFEVSIGPTEAVSALAGMFPPAAAPADSPGGSGSCGECTHQSPTTPTQAAATATATAVATPPAHAGVPDNQRYARTLEDITAQRGPPRTPMVAAAAPAAEEDEAESPDVEAGPGVGVATAEEEGEAEPPGEEAGPGVRSPTLAAATPAAEKDEAEPPDEEAGPEVEVAPASGGVDRGSSSAELERVAAFIASYAGEQEAASAASRTPTKPPFPVPLGISSPSTRKEQLVIMETAERAIELPGFEAFMKMQHGKDRLFRFLTTEHDLHSYYLLAKKHVQETVMKGGKAKGACAVDLPKDPPAVCEKTEDSDVAEIMRMLGGVGVGP